MGRSGAAYVWRVPPPSEADTTQTTHVILSLTKYCVRYELGDVAMTRVGIRGTINSATCSGKSHAALHRQTCRNRLLYAFLISMA
jgi:hypothetical protein